MGDERKTAAEDVYLDEAAAPFRHFAEHIGAIFWVWSTRDRRMLYVSPEYEEVTGRPRAEIYTDPGAVGRAIHPDDRKRVREAFAAQAQGSGEIQYRVLRPEGGTRWVRARAVPIRNEEGEVVSVVGISEDVTARKRVERDQESRYKVLERIAARVPVEESLMLLVEEAERVNPDVRCSLLLLDEDGQHLRHGAAPSLPEFYNEAIDGVEIGPEVGSCGAAAWTREVVIVEDVRTHPFWRDFRDLAERAGLRSCWSQPILTSGGEVLGTFAMYSHEPRRPDEWDLAYASASAKLAGIAIQGARTELALKESERRLRQIMDLVPHRIFAKDRDGRFLLANRAVAESYGTTVDELVGRPHSEVYAESAGLSHMLEDDREVIDSGRAKFIPEETFVDINGSVRILQTTKIPFPMSGLGDPAVLGVAEDITDRKRAEEALRGAERLASVGTLAAGVAHEINNPIGTILLAAQYALEKSKTPDGEGVVQEALIDIVEDARRCKRIVQNVLKFSRDQGSDREPEDVNEVLRHSLDLVRPVAERSGAVIDMRLARELPTVLANSTELEQVFVNLVRNAVEAGEGRRGARVSVTTESVPGFARIRVSDQGAGLSDSSRTHLFEPFYTTRREKGGTGLGLSISHGIVTAHGGAISVEGDARSGTTFTIDLPSAESAQREGESHDQSAGR